jgi:hypothetical protein
MIGKIQDYSKLTSDSIFNTRNRLNNVIAYKVMAPTPWTFYEVLDDLLGNYGNNGYPLFSGRFYCMAFNSNHKLMIDLATSSWVKTSTVKLQEMIRDFVIEYLKKNTGQRISEIDLRSSAQRAFNFVFDDAGMRTAINTAPEILPILKTIPGKETLSYGPKFRDTLTQTFLDLSGMFPGTLEEFTSGIDLPEFKAILKMAFNRNAETYPNELKLDRNLHDVTLNLMTGKLDNKDVLKYLVNNLKFKVFIDQKHNMMAREICIKANIRRSLIADYYAPLISIRSNLASLLD